MSKLKHRSEKNRIRASPQNLSAFSPAEGAPTPRPAVAMIVQLYDGLCLYSSP